MNLTVNICSVCGRQGKTLQCSRCHSKRYCSVDCQKKDWKAGHRHLCRPTNGVAPPPTQKQALQAYKELMALTTSMNTSEAKEQLDRANDEFTNSVRKERQTKQNGKRGTVHRQETPTATVNSTDTSAMSSIESNFTVRIAEEMQHISQYHVTLERKNNPGSDTLDSKEWTHSIVHERNQASKVILKSCDDSDIVEIRLPRRIVSCQMLPGEQPNQLVLRLSFDDASSESPLPRRGKLPVQEAINTIQCLACSQPLLPSSPIKRAAELPVGCWDEIADYLICYSGQSMVDFTVASAAPERGLVLQDSNVLCFHPKDLGNSVCVLAVPGYGEKESLGETDPSPKTVEDAPATIRGDRLWRDITGGATVCCSVCCVRLGFASVEAESFRLLKHRLSITDPSRHSHGPSQQMSTCASFMAREMVRYAESKAIFTFVISREESTTDPTRSNYNTKCILLRLVSWDANIATDVDLSNQLVFGSYAKIVFEETYDRERQERANGDDPMSWVWGGVDLCCPPESGGPPVFDTGVDTNTTERLASQASSSVRLELSSEEYDELLMSLQSGTQLFSKSVSDATVLVKMGPSALSQNRNGLLGLGLTAISLE